MKVGYVLECGPDGADMKVLRHLTSMINPDAEFDYEALSVKTALLRESGKAAKRLIGAGCDKIFIVWDLFPAWREDKGKPCRHEDKETIKSSLAAHQIPENNIHLLCIEEELESWIIADGRALSKFLSKPHRQVNIDSLKNPDRIKDPKGTLTGYFKEHRGNSKYDGNLHAEQIIKHLEDFQKLKKSPTFKRFYLKLTGNSL